MFLRSEELCIVPEVGHPITFDISFQRNSNLMAGTRAAGFRCVWLFGARLQETKERFPEAFSHEIPRDCDSSRFFRNPVRDRFALPFRPGRPTEKSGSAN